MLIHLQIMLFIKHKTMIKIRIQEIKKIIGKCDEKMIVYLVGIRFH